MAHPEGGFTTDIFLEKMAVKLGMTPLEFRRKIFIKEDPKGGFSLSLDTPGRPTSSYTLMQCLNKAAEVIGFEAKYHAPGAKTLPDGRLHGIGIHAHADPHASLSAGRGVTINMCPDGTVKFNTGQSRVQGGPAAFAAIIAETLGVTYKDVGQSWGDPDMSPDGGSQAGSAGVTNNGSAAMNAALDVRSQLFAYAATQLKVTAAELEAEGGKIFVKADPTKTITHAAVMAKIQKPIIGKGTSFASTWRRPDGKWPLGTQTNMRQSAATVYEVAVDPETGEVEVLNWVQVGDAGRVIDRNVCESQIIDSDFAQINKATMWELMHDPQTGVLLTQNLIDDKMLTSMDFDFEKNNCIVLESINASGPYGANGMAEPLATPGYAALINAINNATGLWLSERPLTPWRILRGLGKA